MEKYEACLICKKALKYFESKKEMVCVSCGEVFLSNTSCEDGHYICDTCHAKRGIESIIDYCRKSTSINPLKMVKDMMDDPYIHMHGNEHHVIVGASLITAYHNITGDFDLDAALNEMKARGSEYPGGACGFWGCCGAAVSAGMFFSIVTKTTPLSGKSWGMANLITAKALNRMGNIGGPRCCKRNSFTAVISAAEFMKENYGIVMELSESVCEHRSRNKECIKHACPYYGG